MSLAILFSLLAHLLVLAALVFAARRVLDVEPAPSAKVEVFRAWPDFLHRARKSEHPALPRQAYDLHPTPPPSAPASAERPNRISPPTQSPPAPVPGHLFPSISRLDLGCAHADFMRLTSEEREACRDRFAGTRRNDADEYAGVDPKARAAFDAGTKRETILQTPFLSAMPKKGCRPRVTEHDAAAFGKAQPDFTVEATCVVHF